MCYGENGMVKFLETLADSVFRHNYSMMQILKKIDLWENFGVTQIYTLKLGQSVHFMQSLSTLSYML